MQAQELNGEIIAGYLKPQIYSKDWTIKDRDTGQPVSGTSHMMGVKVRDNDKFGEVVERTVEIKIHTNQVEYARQLHLEYRGKPVIVYASGLGGYAAEGKRAGFTYVLREGLSIELQQIAKPAVIQQAPAKAAS